MPETANKVRFGLQNVYIVPFAEGGEYGSPIKVPGAVSLTTTPEGDSSVFYADNLAYYTAVTNAGYTGELQMAYIPDDAKVAMGLGVIDKNGAFYEDADLVAKPFALLFEVKGDSRNRRNVFYNVTAARPESEDKTTEDSTEPSTETLAITMIPQDINGKNITKLSIEKSDTNQAVYDKFFTSVVKPDEEAA